MSILNVNKINPVGGGSTVTIAGIASVTSSVTAASFVGPIEGNVTGNINNSSNLLLQTGGSEALRIDSSGRIGINYTPGSGDGIFNAKVDSSHVLHLGHGSNKDNYFTCGTSGLQVFRAAGNERLRLTSGGKIGFNYAATPPSEDIMVCTEGQDSPAGVSLSHLSGGNRYGLRLQSISGTNAGITFSPFINSSYQDFMRITYDTTTNDGKLGINNLSPSYALDIQHTGANQANAAVSRFRQITDNGGEDHALMLCRHAGARPGSNGVDLLFQNSGGTTVGKIDHGHSTTQYRTSSDYRLKENAVSISDGITRLKKLKPYRFNFIAEPDKIVDGFFAHEAAVAVPEAVSGTKDEVDSDNNPIIQGIDHSKLVPLLTASLQEAIAKIETLESEVAALKGS